MNLKCTICIIMHDTRKALDSRKCNSTIFNIDKIPILGYEY